MSSLNIPGEMLAAQVVKVTHPSPSCHVNPLTSYSQFNEQYQIHKIPTPRSLGPNEILLKTAAASLCHTDSLVAAGKFQRNCHALPHMKEPVLSRRLAQMSRTSRLATESWLGYPRDCAENASTAKGLRIGTSIVKTSRVASASLSTEHSQNILLLTPPSRPKFQMN